MTNCRQVLELMLVTVGAEIFLFHSQEGTTPRSLRYVCQGCSPLVKKHGYVK
jgi:hypothetical protein